jgi:hypothetical protein
MKSRDLWIQESGAPALFREYYLVSQILKIDMILVYVWVILNQRKRIHMSNNDEIFYSLPNFWVHFASTITYPNTIIFQPVNKIYYFRKSNHTDVTQVAVFGETDGKSMDGDLVIGCDYISERIG